MKNLMLCIAIFASVVVNAQTKVGDAVLPNTVTFGESTLSLNGAGVREKMWIDLYAGGLYLTSKSGDANKIIAADEAMAIKLHIVSRLISSDKMIDAVNEGFENSTKGNTAPIADKIKTFKSYFMDEISSDDVFDITYQPARGVVVYKNGKEKGAIQGMEFKKALFGIWLSSKPADSDLKKAMLGK